MKAFVKCFDITSVAASEKARSLVMLQLCMISIVVSKVIGDYISEPFFKFSLITFSQLSESSMMGSWTT